ncbi:MAG: flagellar hook-associated protein FlgK [Candidatus Acididesulfobacter guangdongensis]|uniref:Flagellar hook-associated protein 1 n=1 Tax=Acididesulfobacter guangdongensis TaxID=2597225 RepID=A0A519BG06_ACIG2|nr:MAG: flagellar hook-associated protein FlgK [Candidatus Acididesulfobacter guangdongensis]
MLSINNIMEIANSALNANETAMNVEGENVANVNTPFYNNENPVFSAAPPVIGAPYNYGTGVNLTAIHRQTDSFVQNEVNSETTQNSYYNTLYQGLQQIQNVFNDTSGSGFNSSITTFFNDLQNVANNPSSTAQRTVLLSDAKTLTGDINNAYTTIANTVASTGTSIKGVIPEINSYTSQIAFLNQQITYAQNAGSNANELRDQRTAAVNSLSKLVNISYYENQNGKLNISLGGNALVSSDTSYNLSTQVNGKNPSSLEIMLDGPDSTVNNITSSVTGGTLGAYVYLQQTAAPSYINQLNSVAASITDNVNAAQFSGFGLDGSTGNYFFNPDLTTAATTNSSTAKPVTDATISTGMVTNPQDLTGDSYTITASNSSGAFSITNDTTGKALSSSQYTVTPSTNNYGQSVYTINFAGVSVNITGTSTTGTAPAKGDTFTVNQLTTAPAFTMAVDPNLSTSQIAAASAVSTAVNPSNTGNATISAGSVINPTSSTAGTKFSKSNQGGQYTITYDGVGSSSSTADFTITNNSTKDSQEITGVPSTVNSSGQQVYSLFFGNPPSSSGNVANGNQPENFHVNITGTPVNGDSFTANILSPSSSTSVTGNGSNLNSSYLTPMTLSQMNAAGLQGNNGNALNMSNIQNTDVPINGTTQTISNYYASIVSDIGTAAQSSNTNYTNSTSVLTNLNNQLSSAVGVNLNDQMTNLTNYQNSYEAAAALSKSAQTIMTALLNMVP